MGLIIIHVLGNVSCEYDLSYDSRTDCYPKSSNLSNVSVIIHVPLNQIEDLFCRPARIQSNTEIGEGLPQ